MSSRAEKARVSASNTSKHVHAQMVLTNVSALGISTWSMWMALRHSVTI